MMTVSQAAAPLTVTSLTVTLFGPMQVAVEGHSLPRLRSRKSLWLLALLVLRQGRPVEREWLAETLWPDADLDQSLTSLRTVLSELRQALGHEGGRLLSPNRRSLCLELGGMAVDLLEFDAATGSRDPVVLKQAVALYRGPLLEGCTEEWVAQERLVREQDCLRVLQTLADAALAAGEWEAAAQYYRQAVGIDPWRESAQRGLMQALSQSGDSNAALTVYQTLTRLLRKDDPRASPDEQTTALYTSLRSQSRRRASQPPVVAAVPAPAVTGYVPHSLTDLIGRDKERDVVAGRLRRFRLVTLTGPGGIGKTRLALAVASEVAAEYADGVWLVSLEALSDGGQVAPQIASTLGLKEDPERSALQMLTAFLRQKRLLLVLDNCEHLLEASARVSAHLLGECAGVQVLATSREALGLTGEGAWAVPGLSVPDPAALPNLLTEYESVQLFVERAQAVNPQFDLTESSTPAVATICTRLEGIPLAIELAAARVRVLSAAQIAARLDDYLSLLTGGSRTALPRQQTLRSTLDWSYDLLGLPERRLLSRLSVFAGGWTLEAAEQVCAGGAVSVSSVLDLLTGLVDKSLVTAVPPEGEREGETRYRFLETVRQYAGERLAECGETKALRDRHLSWCVALAEDAEPHLRGHGQRIWLTRLETEHDNLRAGLAWGAASASGAEQTLRLAGSLWYFWYVRGHWVEAQKHLTAALAREGAERNTVVRVRALQGLARLVFYQGDWKTGHFLSEQMLTISREISDPVGEADSLTSLGYAKDIQGDGEAATSYFEQSLAICRDSGYRFGERMNYASLGNVKYAQQDLAAASSYFEQSLVISCEIGDHRSKAWDLRNLGMVKLYQGDCEAAGSLYEQSLAISRNLGDRYGELNSLYLLGCAKFNQGDLESDRFYMEESLTISQEIGSSYMEARSLVSLGGIAREQNRLAEAREISVRCLTFSRQHNDPELTVYALSGWAAQMLAEGDAALAARFAGAAQAGREANSIIVYPHQKEGYERRRSAARAALGEAAFTAAWEAGRAMTLDEAVEYALGGATQD